MLIEFSKSVKKVSENGWHNACLTRICVVNFLRTGGITRV